MDTLVQADVAVITFIAGSVIPLLVAAVARLRASSRVKAILNFVLSVAAGAGAYIVAHEGAFAVKELVSALVTTYVTSGVAYTHLWKPLGAAKAVAEAVPGGIGKELPVPDALPPLKKLTVLKGTPVFTDSEGILRVKTQS